MSGSMYSSVQVIYSPEPKMTADGNTDERNYRNSSGQEMVSLEEGPKKLAVEGQGLTFLYGKRAVLNGVDINVERGTIYGLLGPSGCGKTTLLKHIIGRLKAKEGTVTVYGKSPGETNFCIPGKGVGYMPQELALYQDITIEETLVYFGCLYIMNIRKLMERINFLLKFLDIPNKNVFVRNLSGGEKRRVSFATALIHEPPLLILDEPTVGVDPLLRHSIWDHLQHLTETNNMTIIITTHYVEEARKAHVVGLMRDGHLLAEMNPESLLQKHGVSTLEDVFFKLCKKETSLLQQTPSLSTPRENIRNKSGSGEIWLTHEELCRVNNAKEILTDDGRDDGYPNMALLHKNKQKSDSDIISCKPTAFRKFRESWIRMATLIAKSFLVLKRNKTFAFFQIFIPAFQVIVFCLCIGQEPFDLPLAVVNNETNIFGFSELLLDTLDNRTFNKVYFDDLPSAIDSVKHGKSKAAIYIGPRFSTALTDRFLEGNNVDNSTIDDSGLDLYLDMTNQQISMTIIHNILSYFEKFTKLMLKQSYQNPRLSNSPIVIKEPVYGEKNPDFTEFMAPGIMLAITYIMAVGLTALSIIIERREGLLDRVWCAGVSSGEVIFSILFTLFVTMLAQIALVMVCMFVVFGLPIHGSVFWIMVCVILAGTSGMAYGLFISSVCKEEVVAMMVAMGSFFPNLLVSGVLWPVEGMDYYLRYISYSLPLTLLSDTTRSIMSRGWDITENDIWIGCAVPIAWTFGLIIISYFIFSFSKR